MENSGEENAKVSLTKLWETIVRNQSIPENLNIEVTFNEFKERLCDPEKEVRQHALRVLSDLIPLLDGNILDENMDMVLSYVVTNLGYPAPSVRKSAIDCLKVYLNYCQQPNEIIRELVFRGIENFTVNDIQINTILGVIMCLPHLMGNQINDTNVEFIIRKLFLKLSQIFFQETALKSLVKIRKKLGCEKFNSYLEKEMRDELRKLCDIYNLDLPNNENFSDSRDATSSNNSAETFNSSEDKIILETEIKLSSCSTINLQIHEKVNFNDNESINNRASKIPTSGSSYNTPKLRRVRFGGEAIKVRTPDSDSSVPQDRQDRDSVPLKALQDSSIQIVVRGNSATKRKKKSRIPVRVDSKKSHFKRSRTGKEFHHLSVMKLSKKSKIPVRHAIHNKSSSKVKMKNNNHRGLNDTKKSFLKEVNSFESPDEKKSSEKEVKQNKELQFQNRVRKNGKMANGSGSNAFTIFDEDEDIEKVKEEVRNKSLSAHSQRFNFENNRAVSSLYGNEDREYSSFKIYPNESTELTSESEDLENDNYKYKHKYDSQDDTVDNKFENFHYEDNANFCHDTNRNSLVIVKNKTDLLTSDKAYSILQDCNISYEGGNNFLVNNMTIVDGYEEVINNMKTLGHSNSKEMHNKDKDIDGDAQKWSVKSGFFFSQKNSPSEITRNASSHGNIHRGVANEMENHRNPRAISFGRTDIYRENVSSTATSVEEAQSSVKQAQASPRGGSESSGYGTPTEQILHEQPPFVQLQSDEGCDEVDKDHLPSSYEIPNQSEDEAEIKEDKNEETFESSTEDLLLSTVQEDMPPSPVPPSPETASIRESPSPSELKRQTTFASLVDFEQFNDTFPRLKNISKSEYNLQGGINNVPRRTFTASAPILNYNYDKFIVLSKESIDVEKEQHTEEETVTSDVSKDDLIQTSSASRVLKRPVRRSTIPRKFSTSSRAEVNFLPSSLKAHNKPKESLGEVIDQLSSSDWEVTMKGLRNLTKVSRNQPESLEFQMHNICVLLGKHIKNLRSQVARAACVACCELFATSRRGLDMEIEELAGPLFQRTADTNKFLRNDAADALSMMAQRMPAQKIIPVVMKKGCAHQNGVVRAAAMKVLYQVTENLGAEKVFQLPKEMVLKLLLCAANSLTEGSLDSRKNGKNLFNLLGHHPNFHKYLVDAVPPQQLRHIEKTLKSLKR